MIDAIAGFGFAGYFVDEPTSLRDCYCPACRAKYATWYNGDLATASDEQKELFRQKCVVDYTETIASYCKANHPQLETMCCLMPHDRAMWAATADIAALDNLGTDIYWVNNDNDVEAMTPMLTDMAVLCKQKRKVHHEWLQCWHVRQGREPRILEQGRILVHEHPDTLYVWAWKGQIGTTETCDDPATAWRYAVEVLRMAKEA